jgi:hypothetical protein
MTMGRRIPATEIARILAISMDFSSMISLMPIINDTSDGIIPTRKNELISPIIEIIRAIVVICMKVLSNFCAYCTKVTQI